MALLFVRASPSLARFPLNFFGKKYFFNIFFGIFLKTASLARFPLNFSVENQKSKNKSIQSHTLP